MLESLSVTEKPLLILASNSPRRRQLLSLTGWNFTVSAADVDESVSAAAIGRDEAETLGFIEELDSALHIGILPGIRIDSRPA